MLLEIIIILFSFDRCGFDFHHFGVSLRHDPA